MAFISNLGKSDLCMHQYLPCLKELELEDARALVRTPDFGGLPCLQKLILKGCESLEEIHESLGNHSSLVSVNIRSCDKLRRFPTIVKMDKLKILIISKCKALAVFLQIEASMDNLKSVEGNFDALKCQTNSKLSGCRQFEKLPKEHLRSSLNLKSGSIKQRILSHIPRFLRKLNLSCNHFTQLDFSLSRLTSLKVLELTGCSSLVELPELPSSLAILKADYCGSLEGIIRDEIHTNCKWLSQVSIVRGGKNIIGGERLIETMLQGNAGVESGCMFLQLQGLDIARGFEPGLVEGGRCGMQLPENWFNDFSGFLMCGVVDTPSSSTFDPVSPKISMKHEEEEENGGLEDCQYDVVHWEENRQHGDYTWVGYLPFSLLRRHTSWWNPTSTAIQIHLHSYYDTLMCGFKLVPKRGAAESSSSGQMETTPSSYSSEISLNDDPYKCQFRIHHDSKSALQCSFDHYEFDQYGGLFGVYDSF